MADEVFDIFFDSEEEEEGFDEIYLPLKESVPDLLTNREQGMNSWYLLRRIDSRSTIDNEYTCKSCRKDLFYHDCMTRVCPNCQTEINENVYDTLKQMVLAYEQSEKALQNSINKAIETSLTQIFHGSNSYLIHIISEFVAMSYVTYHQDIFKDHKYNMKSINEILNENRQKYKFGDVVGVGYYGNHFIGMEQNRLKLIPNPCYESNSDTLMYQICVPTEISNDMPDVLRFYRMNHIHIFRTLDKIYDFPVSLISLSPDHYAIKKLFSLFHSEHFDESFKFFIESKNFQNITSVNVEIPQTMKSFRYDDVNKSPNSVKHELFQIAKLMKIQHIFFFVFEKEMNNSDIDYDELQSIIDQTGFIECRKRIKWKILNPYDDSRTIWKVYVSISAHLVEECDHYEAFYLMKNYSGLDVDLPLFVRICYDRLLTKNDDFKTFLTNMHNDEDIHEMWNEESETSCVQIFWAGVGKMENNKWIDNSIDHLKKKYRDELVIKLSPYLFKSSFTDQLLAY